MREWLRAERSRFALEARNAVGVVGNGLRQNLKGDVASELRIVRSIDFAHPPGAQRGDHLVRSDSRARSKHQVDLGERLAPYQRGRAPATETER